MRQNRALPMSASLGLFGVAVMNLHSIASTVIGYFG